MAPLALWCNMRSPEVVPERAVNTTTPALRFDSTYFILRNSGMTGSEQFRYRFVCKLLALYLALSYLCQWHANCAGALSEDGFIRRNGCLLDSSSSPPESPRCLRLAGLLEFLPFVGCEVCEDDGFVWLDVASLDEVFCVELAGFEVWTPREATKIDDELNISGIKIAATSKWPCRAVRSLDSRTLFAWISYAVSGCWSSSSESESELSFSGSVSLFMSCISNWSTEVSVTEDGECCLGVAFDAGLSSMYELRFQFHFQVIFSILDEIVKACGNSLDIDIPGWVTQDSCVIIKQFQWVMFQRTVGAPKMITHRALWIEIKKESSTTTTLTVVTRPKIIRTFVNFPSGIRVNFSVGDTWFSILSTCHISVV